MKPFFALIANGQDVTKVIGDRLVSITLNDNAGTKNDILNIAIDGRPSGEANFETGKFPKLPKLGATLELFLGYAKSETMVQPADLTRMGTFTLEAQTVTCPPYQIRLRGHGTKLNTKFKGNKTLSHHQKTVGEIVEAIAEDYDLEVEIDDKVKDTFVQHMDQKNMSDMAFLTYLAHKKGCVVKVVDEKLFFGKHGAVKEAGGVIVPEVRLALETCASWTFDQQARSEYKSVRSRTVDKDTGKVTYADIEIKTGESEAVAEQSRTYPTEQEAVDAATAKASALERTKKKFKFKAQGHPDFRAESKVILVEPFYPDMPREWMLVNAVHTFTKGEGYTVGCECEIPTKETSGGDESAPAE